MYAIRSYYAISRDLLVEVDSGNFTSGGPIQIHNGSPPFQGGDPALDSNCDPETHRTMCLAYGADTVDPTVDCGFIPPPTGCRVTGGGNAGDKEVTWGA